MRLSPYFTGSVTGACDELSSLHILGVVDFIWQSFSQNDVIPKSKYFTTHNSLSCKALQAIRLEGSHTMPETLSIFYRLRVWDLLLSYLSYFTGKILRYFTGKFSKTLRFLIWKTFSPNMMCLKQKFSQKTNMEPIHSLGSFTMSGTLYFTGSVFTCRGSNYRQRF